jgi:hypothetical protein
MRCMVLRSRLRRYFGLYFTLPTSCFLLRIPTRVGSETAKGLVVRSLEPLFPTRVGSENTKSKALIANSRLFPTRVGSEILV